MTHTKSFFSLCFVMLIISCLQETPYPAQLTEAERQLLSGNYNLADSLLADFDRKDTAKSYHVQMYRELLRLERLFVEAKLSEANFSVADSLARYFNGHTRESVMSQLFLGSIYQESGDYPSALDSYLKAGQVGSDDMMLKMWLNKMQGDLYFDQRMLVECSDYYRRSFHYAEALRDTFRMALGAYSMAKVAIINNDVDSTIYYLRKTIEWGSRDTRRNALVPHGKSLLADVYIQIEEYDKAREVMTYDSINEYNWAYWHLGQRHLDSASMYFTRMIAKSDWRERTEYFRVLASIAEESGSKEKAFYYHKLLNEAKDSLAVHSQADKTNKVKARHDYDVIKQERDDATEQSRIMQCVFAAVIILVLLVAIAARRAWRKYKWQKEQELSQEKHLRQAETLEKEQSLARIKDSEKQISQLQEKLHEAQYSNNVDASERAKLSVADNEHINGEYRHGGLEIGNSALYQRIKLNAGKEKYHLSDEEWLQLASLMDSAYDHFTARLCKLYEGITEHELHICYLVKLDVAPTNIGCMLYKSKAAIGMARQRLYKKLTGKNGTAKDFNDFIMRF